jgi:uncharacterized protein (TIGR03086 family)
MNNDGPMSESDVNLLESVLLETEATIGAVRPDQLHLPTPCADFEVTELVNHVVGWARHFAARFSGGVSTEDPNGYQAGEHPAAEFHDAAQKIVGAYRSAAEPTAQLPAGFIVMEFLTHGWDLAVAIGRAPDYPASAAELGLKTATEMLKPEYRGSAFLPEIEVASTNHPVDRLVAFLGRDPGLFRLG